MQGCTPTAAQSASDVKRRQSLVQPRLDVAKQARRAWRLERIVSRTKIQQFEEHPCTTSRHRCRAPDLQVGDEAESDLGR